MDHHVDDRGVSNVIGAVLIFGIVVVLIATYQSQVVPNQNRAAEFEHSNTVQNDMVELRNAILTAKSSGRTTFAEVKLGTTYQNRILAVNPPPPSGTLRTGPMRPISITADGSTTNVCPGANNIQTRTLRFQPGYNVYDNAPDLVYENTVLYLDFGDEKIMLTDEELVKNGGDTVDLVPLNTSLDRQGVNTESIEPKPGNIRESELSNTNVTLPTNLSEDTWEDLLAEDLPQSNVTVSNGNLTLETGGEISLSCSPVGLSEPPSSGSRSDSGSQSDGDSEINPAGPNNVELRGATKDGGTVTAQLINTGDRNTNITAVRIPFIFVSQSNTDGSSLGPYDVINANTSTTVRSDLSIAGPLATLDTKIELPGNGTRTDITYDFQNATKTEFNGGGFVVATVEFTDGARGTYFIEIPSK